MENYGLAIYLEKNIMHEGKRTPITTEQLIARIITHEIVHMW